MIWTCGGYLVRRHALQAGDDGATLTTERTLDFRTIAGLDDAQREWFYSTDEVKPVMHLGRSLLLVTASWRGAVALLDVDEARVLFCAPLPDAHSAELLPDGSIVAAASDKNDKLVWYRHVRDLKFEAAAQYPLPHAHGVVRDRQLECLWVAGGDKLLQMPLPTGSNWAPQQVIALPDADAHDLSPDPLTDQLILTTGRGVWRFCPVTQRFTPFDDLHNTPKVKCVSVDPVLGRLTMVASQDAWWSDGFDWKLGDQVLRVSVPDVRLYKARWNRTQQRI